MTKYLMCIVISSLIQPVVPVEKPKRLNKEIKDKIKTLYILPDNVVMDIQAYLQLKKDSAQPTSIQEEAWRNENKPNKWMLFKNGVEIAEWRKSAVYFEKTFEIISKEGLTNYAYIYLKSDTLIDSEEIVYKEINLSGHSGNVRTRKYTVKEAIDHTSRVKAIIDASLIIKDSIDPKAKSFIAICSKDQWTIYNADKFKCTEEKIRELIAAKHPFFNWKWNSSKKFWEKQVIKVLKP